MVGRVLDFLKDLRVILVVVLLVSWGGASYYFISYKDNVKLQMEARDAEMSDVMETLEQIGQLVPVYVVRSDVPSGKRVEETDLDVVDVPVGISEKLVGDIKDITDKYYKIGLTKGSLITADGLYEKPITSDMRLLDVITHVNPVGLRPGGYVDIRMLMPLGEDYVALPHKQVLEINAGVLKIVVNEQDILTYNSMLVDSIIYPGTHIYAIEYLEGGAQKPADAFYPPSANIVAIAQKDPNLLEAIQDDIIIRREALELGISGAGLGLSERDDVSRVIEKGRASILSTLAESQREVDKERREFEKAQGKGESSGVYIQQ